MPHSPAGLVLSSKTARGGNSGSSSSRRFSNDAVSQRSPDKTAAAKQQHSGNQVTVRVAPRAAGHGGLRYQRWRAAGRPTAGSVSSSASAWRGGSSAASRRRSSTLTAPQGRKQTEDAAWQAVRDLLASTIASLDAVLPPASADSPAAATAAAAAAAAPAAPSSWDKVWELTAAAAAACAACNDILTDCANRTESVAGSDRLAPGSLPLKVAGHSQQRGSASSSIATTATAGLLAGVWMQQQLGAEGRVQQLLAAKAALEADVQRLQALCDSQARALAAAEASNQQLQVRRVHAVRVHTVWHVCDAPAVARATTPLYSTCDT
jgi:hypothetical protein